MKHILLLLAVFATGLVSCQNPETPEALAEQLMQLPDTILISPERGRKEFQVDFSEMKINDTLTSSLAGEWLTTRGKMSFLNTSLEVGNKVVFYDTSRTSMTGWGDIKYNKAVKFYFAKSGSRIYDYFVKADNELVLIMYEYRNDNLSFKEKPEMIEQELLVEFDSDRRLFLKLDGKRVTLEKENTTANIH